MKPSYKIAFAFALLVGTLSWLSRLSSNVLEIDYYPLQITGSSSITLPYPTLGEVNSEKGHTGSAIPAAFKQLLQKHGEINENATSLLGAASAVDSLANECQWISAESSLKNPACLDSIGFKHEEASVDESTFPSLLDVVVPTIRNLDFLEQWREFIEPYHIIIIQDGDPDIHLTIPAWADFELYNRKDIQQILGEDRTWIISSRDASIRNFGFLVSKKKFIYTLDDDCLPAFRPDGTRVNAISEHMRNLLKPSVPFFFNTLHDPYRPGSDFVRGYPYSLRNGVPTAISHGLWLNAPDYDAPTQLLKPKERNVHYHDTVITIPHRTLYPMCSMNVAFNRELIGPAFMQGLMGDGQPWARYDDMFAGWASKVVADALGLGVKNGAPYIFHNKASNPFANLKKEYKGLFWQEDLIRFFHQVELSCSTAVECYRQLAIQVKTITLNPYFERLARAMEIWVDLWLEQLAFRPSRKSVPQPSTAELNPSGRCWTYASRYALCRQIQSLSIKDRARIFHQIATHNFNTTEVAILRINPMEWNDDQWLHACAFITETGRERQVVLLSIDQQLEKIPLEFRSLIELHNEDDMRRIFGASVYVDGKMHGDMMLAWWMRNHPQFEFAWMFESDFRLIGDYGVFLSHSKTTARAARETRIKDLVVPIGEGDAHLIFYSDYPGYIPEKESFGWMSETHFAGRWKKKESWPRPYVYAGLMGFGISKQLAKLVFRNAIEGTYNDNMEVNTPFSAIEAGLKFMLVPHPGHFICCILSYEQAYLDWAKSPECRTDYIVHPVKSGK